MSSLWVATHHCEFCELNDVLLDQLVYEIRDLKLQRWLLARSKLSLPLALDEARAAEMSDKSSAEIQYSQPGDASALKTQTVHHEGPEPSASSDEEEEVSRLRASKKKKGWMPPVRPLRIVPWAKCKFKSAI